MECFQNKTLEQGRKRETASETNIPPRSDTLWVKNEIASLPFLSLRAKRSSLVLLVNVNTRTLKSEIASPNEKARFAVTPPNLSLRGA